MIDFSSSTWQAVKEHADAAIENARLRLETSGLSAAETEFQRGRIKAMKDILAMAEPRPAIPSTDPVL
jgi:hypothetical protein